VPPTAPPDGDADGMPDVCELAHAALGIDPAVAVADAVGSARSRPLTGVSGYTHLAVYLNRLADGLTAPVAAPLFADGFEPGVRATFSPAATCEPRSVGRLHGTVGFDRGQHPGTD
jgi:hypothetical protein